MLERLDSAAECVAASGGDPLVTQLVTRRIDDLPSWRYGAAVGAHCNWWGDPELYVVGPPEDAAALMMTALASEPHGSFLSVPQAARPLLPYPDAGDDEDGWAFRWTDRAPDAAGPAAAWLADADDEVAELLGRAFPDASVQPGGPHARRWAGIREPGGRLVACAADATADDRVGFIASIAVDPGSRTAGLGATISAWATRALLAEHPRVGLWHFHGNDAADRLYTRLGFRDEHRMVGLPLSPSR